ncbi:Bug family tripartite tricarboxylate transporter substrate binding protein [Teichococcus aestuarii]|uniref:ABC transporter substrate-binding protein n=1 Tax=Teichococcus aestuarii TaxID=568898 RepID=A0A2U1V429_9PROT|nr:tripartite tricarboxylate transporter substrate binding protein [Pseudoroseomonas aestuarii]PWC28644.1 ABC transporter substrate-binding protein [Pseudoroseomonas aestuarii]
MQRRTLLGAAAAAACALPGLAHAAAGAARAAYPDKPIRVVVPFPPGGATDTWCRLVTAPMAEALGQPFVVDCRSGAASMIGSEAVARAAPDGHTLLFTISSLVQSPVVFRRAPYDAEKDFAPIGQLGTTSLVLACNKDVPGRTLAEFVAAAKGRNYSFGSYSPASTGHVFGQLFSDVAGLGMTHVGYRGEAPELLDLIGGRLHCALVSMTSAKGYLLDGTLRPLACLGRQRLPSLPGVPTFVELGYPEDFAWSGFVGMLAPAGTPAAIVETLAGSFRAATERAEVRRTLAEQDFILQWLGPSDMAREVRRARQSWAELVERTGISAE